jgi:membrane protein YqaA with SNARE-associated domain
MIESWITPDMGLAGLFLASFLSATLFPGGSEVVLFGVLKLYPQSYWPAVLLATLGNTLGGLTSVGVGYLLPNTVSDSRALQLARRFGSISLLLSWAPIIGDALCVAAGWLRLNWLPVIAFMALGKFARYLVIAQLANIHF